jgi:hypothetical protein
MILSNVINEDVPTELYEFDANRVALLALALDAASADLNINTETNHYHCRQRRRNPQTVKLLSRLKESLIPCRHNDWLSRRDITDLADIHSIDHNGLSYQDMLDLRIYPDDVILDNFSPDPMEGPTFLDERNGQLVGMCIRNVSKDLDYAAAEKYTISNFGWFLHGFDLYDPNDEVFIVEGVFDSISMRKSNYPAIATASSYPTALQIACLQQKFKKLKLCFDNDFWGHVGAHIVSEITGLETYFPKLKDPGCYMTESVELERWDSGKLGNLVQQEIKRYNISKRKLRPLPYN